MTQTAKNQYADVHLTIAGQDRIVSGQDISLILHGQPRPLRTALRATVSVRCSIVDLVQTSGSDIVCLVNMKESTRIPRSEFLKKAVA